MADFTIRQFKAGFFDTAALKKQADRDRRKALGHAGGYARKVIKSGLKYRAGVSAPGTPPNVHRSDGFTRKKRVKGQSVQQASSPLRELVFYALDSATDSVVIGPAKFGGSGAPGRLERGGSGPVTLPDGRKVSGHYRPRPFVGPGGREAARRLPQILRGRT